MEVGKTGQASLRTMLDAQGLAKTRAYYRALGVELHDAAEGTMTRDILDGHCAALQHLIREHGYTPRPEHMMRELCIGAAEMLAQLAWLRISNMTTT